MNDFHSRFKEYVVSNKWQVGLGLIGLVLMGWGMFQAILQVKKDSAVEIVSVDESSEGGEVVVDVGGAVEKPGVYRLGTDARINDALVVAGGLSVEADRTWVARFVNLASKLEDGMKIYVPSQGEGGVGSQESGVSYGSSGVVAGAAFAPVGATASQVNINTASASELDSLWGIGEKRVADIIENRPYSDVSELLSKAGIPKNVYERIKDEVNVY